MRILRNVMSNIANKQTGAMDPLARRAGQGSGWSALPRAWEDRWVDTGSGRPQGLLNLRSLTGSTRMAPADLTGECAGSVAHGENSRWWFVRKATLQRSQ